MIPFANDTVTLWHKGAAGYEPHVIPNCSFRHSPSRSGMDGAIIVRAETVCRIPAGNIRPTVGDAIALGEHTANARNDIELVRLLEKLRPSGAFRVESVSDNARPGVPVPHYAARGV